MPAEAPEGSAHHRTEAEAELKAAAASVVAAKKVQPLVLPTLDMTLEAKPVTATRSPPHGVLRCRPVNTPHCTRCNVRYIYIIYHILYTAPHCCTYISYVISDIYVYITPQCDAVVPYSASGALTYLRRSLIVAIQR